MEDNAAVPGLNPYEAFTLVQEPLPFTPSADSPIDVIPGWTLYRRVAPPRTPTPLPITPSSPGYWMPVYHFHLSSLSLLNLGLLHHYSATHELAAFTSFFLVTKLLPGTGGARRSIMYGKKDVEAGRTRAKVHTTGGNEAEGATDARDIEWVEMETGEMRGYLEKEWGFRFRS